MKVILKENEEADAFFEELINKTAERILRRVENRIEQLTKAPSQHQQEWISGEEAKKILGIRSKNKMQQIRDESPMNGIKISQNGKIFLYYKPSLYKFLERRVLK